MSQGNHVENHEPWKKKKKKKKTLEKDQISSQLAAATATIVSRRHHQQQPPSPLTVTAVTTSSSHLKWNAVAYMKESNHVELNTEQYKKLSTADSMSHNDEVSMSQISMKYWMKYLSQMPPYFNECEQLEVVLYHTHNPLTMADTVRFSR